MASSSLKDHASRIIKMLEQNKYMLNHVKSFCDANHIQGTNVQNNVKKICKKLNENQQVEIKVDPARFHQLIKQAHSRLQCFKINSDSVLMDYLDPIFRLMKHGQAELTFNRDDLMKTVNIIANSGTELQSYEQLIIECLRSKQSHQLQNKQTPEYTAYRISEFKSSMVIRYKFSDKVDEALIQEMKKALLNISQKNYSLSNILDEYKNISKAKPMLAWLNGDFPTKIQELLKSNQETKLQSNIYMYLGIALNVQYLYDEIMKRGQKEENYKFNLLELIQGDLDEALLLGFLYQRLRDTAFKTQLIIVNDMEAMTHYHRYIEFPDDQQESLTSSTRKRKKVERQKIDEEMEGCFKQLRPTKLRRIERAKVHMYLVYLESGQTMKFADWLMSR